MSTSDRISIRAARVSESATMAVTRRAAELRAQGKSVIGYGAGEPDFPTPGHIIAAAVDAAGDPATHHYSPSAGLPELREAVAVKTARDSGYEVESSQVVVTNGAKQAIYLSCQLLLDPGDEALIPAPFWVTYPEAVKLADGIPVLVETEEAARFTTDVDQLEAARTERTKLLVFASPGNPTGTVYSPAEIAAIGRWAAEHGIWVVTDEIYEHLVYGDAVFTSMPAAVPEVAERCIVVNGVSKTYAMTGWRVGWLIAPGDLAIAAVGVQSHLSSNVANVAQRGALAAVTGPLTTTLDMRGVFDRRRRVMVDMLNSVPGIECSLPDGAFYCFPNVSGLLGRPLAGQVADTSLELATLLLEEAEIAVVPGEAFGTPGYLRLSFALGDDDLVEGLERLQRLVEIT